MKPSEWSQDLFDSMQKDAAEGFMSEPVELDKVDLGSLSLTRRLAVREPGLVVKERDL